MCLGKFSRSWEVCRFPGAVVDPTKTICGKYVCVPYDVNVPKREAWDVVSGNVHGLECRGGRRKKFDVMVIDMKYTHGTFFHFMGQVLMKLYIATSELYSNTSLHIIMAGQYTKGHTDWVQLFSHHPIITMSTLQNDNKPPCWNSVSVLHLDDWFNEAFHLLYLEWHPEFAVKTFADFLHMRSGAYQRTLIPRTNPLKVCVCL